MLCETAAIFAHIPWTSTTMHQFPVLFKAAYVHLGFLLLFFLVRAGLFECFHNPQNSCMDYKIIVSEEVVVYVVRMTWKWLRLGADLNNFFSFFSRLCSQLLVMRSHCRCTMTNIISVVLKYEMHLSLVENKCKLAPGKN